MSRKWPSINIIRLMSNTTMQDWNTFLTTCLLNKDVKSLEKVYYGLQVGMDDLVKEKLNSEKYDIFFLRLIKSLEITAKKIYRIKYPSPLDDPIRAINMKNSLPFEYQKFLRKKQKRDALYEAWLQKVRF